MKTRVLLNLSILLLISVISVAAQNADDEKSIGGSEHLLSIYGVKIGMDVPSALKAVFVSAERKPGEEKPDALRKEGKGKRDIRVIYKGLPKGELQIVFANGQTVKEIRLRYKKEPNVDDMRLPITSTIGSTKDGFFDSSAAGRRTESAAVIDETGSIEGFSAQREGQIEAKSAKRIGNIDRSRSELLDGARYDDRYTVGFADRLKQQRIWWREEKSDDGYTVRMYFLGKKLTDAGGKQIPTIVEKLIVLAPKDEEYFYKER